MISVGTDIAPMCHDSGSYFTQNDIDLWKFRPPDIKLGGASPSAERALNKAGLIYAFGQCYSYHLGKLADKPPPQKTVERC